MTLGDHIAHCVLLTRLGRPHPNFFSRMEGGATVHRFPDWRLKIFRVTLGTLNSMKKFRLVLIIYPLTS